LFVTFGMYNGFADIFSRAAAEPKLSALMTPFEGVAGSYATWVWLTVLSMMAIMFLPRQFQVTVIENLDEKHLGKAIWLFPLYMLAINLFVLPIAFGGLLRFPEGGVDGDTFVLTLPMAQKQEWLALLVFGGIFWKGGTRRGALCALLAGFAVWFYTLLLPALARSGWLPISLLEQGPFGIALLKPLALFGLAGLDQITHAMIWSMLANIGSY